MTHSVSPRYRPAIHLTPPQGWMNDPVGFIHWQGMWHLFYQHNPHEPRWGPMHWGHARSADLVHWEHLPIALAPDSLWDQGGCFSGSALETPEGSLLLMYTGVIPHAGSPPDQVQCTALSTDGIHFMKSSQNPGIDKSQIPEDASPFDFRDPRLISHDGHIFALIGSHDRDGRGQVLLYRARDLISWEFISILLKGNSLQGTMWECPDLFSIGGSDILMVSPQYMLPEGDAYRNLHSVMAITGTMDWKQGRFHPIAQQPLDWGFDFYAPQTALSPDGRRILTAWMDMWEQPCPPADLGHGWAGAMTLPRELILRNGRICSKPISELRQYRRNSRDWGPFALTDSLEIQDAGACYELICEIDPQNASSIGMAFFTGPAEETRLVYTPGIRVLQLDRSASGHGSGGIRQVTLLPDYNTLHLQIFRDYSSLEVFINHGEAVMSARIYPTAGGSGVRLWTPENCDIIELKLWELEAE